MSIGLFEVATAGEDEGRIAKQAAQDKLAAAVYDVRQKFGSYLFQADSPQGFDDRAKLSYVDICETIEPHLHARTGVYARVMKALKREWRQAAGGQPVDPKSEYGYTPGTNQVPTFAAPLTPASAGGDGPLFGAPIHTGYRQATVTENTYAQREDANVAGSQAGPKGIRPPAPVPVHVHGPQLEGRRRQAGESVEVGNIPECDIHKYEQHQGGVPAAYDGKTQMGPWANMCEDHFKSHGVGLGTGRGQRLIQRGASRRRQAGEWPPSEPPQDVPPEETDLDRLLRLEQDNRSRVEKRPDLNPNAIKRRHACYPGCHENEAHAKKFHKDKDDEKEARRRQAAGGQFDPNEQAAYDKGRGDFGDTSLGGTPDKSVSQNPDRAHQVLDHTHEVADQHNQRHHQIVDHAHDLVDQRSQGYYQNPGSEEEGFNYEDPFVPGDPTGQPFQSPFEVNPGNPQHQFPFEAPQEGPPRHSTGFDPEEYLGLQANRRYADDGAYEEHAPDHPELDTNVTYKEHLYEPLKPAGDFEGYKDRVDQGADGKVDRDFIHPNGGGVREHHENGGHNFVTSSYQAIARMIRADGPGVNVEAPGGGAPAPPGPGAASMPGSSFGAPAGGGASAPPGGPQLATPGSAGAGGGGAPGAGSGTPVPVTQGIQPMASYQRISAMMRESTGGTLQPGAGGIGTPGGPTPVTNIQVPGAQNRSVPGGLPGPVVQGPMSPGQYTGRKWASQMVQEVGTREARIRLLAVCRSHGVLDDKIHARISNLLTKKVADSNYLQKADEALTKVLNEKAEEFQNTIAPLQQALITIQQAEQLTNPLNVSPPAGTVNVLPGQQGPGGGAPQGQGGLGASPAAAGLAGQPAPPGGQQMAARRRQAGDLEWRRVPNAGYPLNREDAEAGYEELGIPPERRHLEGPFDDDMPGGRNHRGSRSRRPLV